MSGERPRSDTATTTQRVVAFARERFIGRMESLLDDPYGVLGDDAKTAARFTYFAELRQLGEDLGFSIDLLINELGTDFEAKRLRALMAL